MGFRVFEAREGWGSMYASVRFTIGALRASKVHAALAKGLVGQLERWGVIDAARSKAKGATVDANAAVAWCDGALDDAIKRHARQCNDDVDNNREAAAYTAYYKDNPHEYTDLGLESEIAAIAHFPKAAEAFPPSKALATRNAAVAEAVDEGQKAIAQRNEAAMDATRSTLAVNGWRDGANKSRRTVYAALVAYAAENNLPRDYPDRFFPANSKNKPRAKAKDTDET